MLSANEIRKKYIEFYKSNGHTEIPSASLVPENDPTLLFVNSGMFPLVPYLLGEKHPQGTQLVDSQKCFRAEDIDEVGDNRHNTFFEMLGNWSLGDYFKKEQLNWIFEFLTKELQIDPNKLYVSVYRGNKKLNIPKDTEAADIWKNIFKSAGIEAKDIDMAEKDGMQDGRIFYYDESENWWSRAGVPENMPVGEPGGPDSEMFYDLGADLKRHENSEFKNQPCHPACDCGRFIEIGNNVFMQYHKTDKGFEPLKKKNIDFGGGLERLTMVAQGKNNVYQTDLFTPLIDKIAEISNKKYQDNERAFEIIADHIKAATMIMAEEAGIEPSNTDQGYIIRRLIRRAVRYGKQLDINEIFTFKIAEQVIEIYKEQYPEVKKNKNFIENQLIQEEEKFAKVLKDGAKKAKKVISKKTPISDDKFLKIMQTKGKAKIIKKIHQDMRSNNDTKAYKKFPVPLTKDEVYNATITGKELFDLYQSFGFPQEMMLEIAQSKNLFADRAGFREELKKHQELSRKGAEQKFKGGLADTQEDTAKLHTATHLLLAALRQVLGPNIMQKGSNITGERLRFDFNYDQKLTDEQKQEIESIVNAKISEDLPISFEEMTVDEAKEKGAIGVFEHKYGDKVKVYKMGDYSMEICGGPHAKNTGELGKFKIKKEESSSAGIRRIKAILG